MDTNVFVSSILCASGTPARILDVWRYERFQLLISDAILDEMGRVLRYPKIVARHGWTEAEIDRFLHALASLTIKTPGSLALDVITNDPSDNRYLECAVEGSADYIVSGDRDLLALGSYEGIAIVRPSALLLDMVLVEVLVYLEINGNSKGRVYREHRRPEALKD